MCVADASLADRLGVSPNYLVDPSLMISVADNAGLVIKGAVFLTLSMAVGTTMSQMVYLAQGVGEFYLSQEACEDLGIIAADFPQPQVDQGREPQPRPLTAPSGRRNLGGLKSDTGKTVHFIEDTTDDDFPHVRHHEPERHGEPGEPEVHGGKVKDDSHQRDPLRQGGAR